MLTPCTQHTAPYTLHLIHICAFVTLGQFLEIWVYVRRDENIATTQKHFRNSLERERESVASPTFKSGI
jgi:hypothetical protein